MQVENNDSIKEYYVKLHNMYKNAVNMLTAINQSLSTKASEITIDLANTDNTTTTVRIPSFLYLENKIEQLDNNFSNLFDMPNSGEAWFSKSSNMYKLKMIKSNVAPLAPEFSNNNIYARHSKMSSTDLLNKTKNLFYNNEKNMSRYNKPNTIIINNININVNPINDNTSRSSYHHRFNYGNNMTSKYHKFYNYY